MTPRNYSDQEEPTFNMEGLNIVCVLFPRIIVDYAIWRSHYIGFSLSMPCNEYCISHHTDANTENLGRISVGLKLLF